MATEAKRFWVVWNENGRAPVVKHPTQDSAEREALRLARGNPGQRFHVLALLGTCVNESIRWERVPEEMPF